MAEVGQVLQVANSVSPTGFVKVVGIGNSDRHPNPSVAYWDFLIAVFDLKTGQTKGKIALTKDQMEDLEKQNQR